MRAQTSSAHTAHTALTACTPTPHDPYCLHSLLYIESSFSLQCVPKPPPPTPPSPPTPPPRTLLPPLTAVDREFLQASNACPNPLRPHRPHRLHPHPARPLLHASTQIQPEYAVFFLLDSMPVFVCFGQSWASSKAFFAGTVHRIYPSQTRYASDAGLTRGSLLISCTRKGPNATLLVLLSTAALEDWGSAALAAAIKSGSAAGPFCGRGRGPQSLAKP